MNLYQIALRIFQLLGAKMETRITKRQIDRIKKIIQEQEKVD